MKRRNLQAPETGHGSCFETNSNMKQNTPAKGFLFVVPSRQLPIKNKIEKGRQKSIVTSMEHLTATDTRTGIEEPGKSGKQLNCGSFPAQHRTPQPERLESQLS